MAKPSLHAIAAACDVSTATVSRALSGHPAVHRETRRQIVATARKQGYIRNELIGKLMSHVRAGHTQRFLGNLAIIHIPSEPQPRLLAAHRCIIAGAAARAKELGFQLDEFSVSRDGLGPEGYARVLRARGVQGVIFLYTEPSPLMTGFPWSEFACVEIDYGRVEPELHTVCIDHFLTLTLALTRLQAMGYRRIGFFVERRRDRRISHKWSAAFASFQRHSGAIGTIPLLIPERLTEREFLDWRQRHRPDLVVGHMDEALVWLQRAGLKVPEDIGCFSLNCNNLRRPCAGLDLQMELQGLVAAEAIISQIQRGERGLPAHPQTLMVRGSWVDGPTLRATPPAAGKA
ncbi:MAG: LacI family DNA-binding transcriptional regulator [Verrucomicrobia bacterium]|nr:LacI family DNA-binding transcriptional regulator [Verrucomicrobiota bacterium]